jgi:hypothetical protein
MAGRRVPELRVKNWKQLLGAVHSPNVVGLQERQGGRFRSNYVFRGMSDSGWSLMTSLARVKSPNVTVVESALLRSFRKYAPRGTFARDSDWEALAVAQHNGLPTRLLDWSVSPLIAAHFATCESEHFKKDGVIWAVDVVALRDTILPKRISKPLRKAPAVVFDVAILEDAFPRLASFDATRAKLGDACVFFEPPSIDARIANQTGILSAMNGPDASHHAYFESIAAAYPKSVRRIVIQQSAKPEIRDMLDLNNIHERMLFPGLPGLCDWLRRYYSPVAAPALPSMGHRVDNVVRGDPDPKR